MARNQHFVTGLRFILNIRNPNEVLALSFSRQKEATSVQSNKMTCLCFCIQIPDACIQDVGEVLCGLDEFVDFVAIV